MILMKWRRRESNPDGDSPNRFCYKELQSGQPNGAAPEHRANATCGHRQASIGKLISEAWPSLPPHIQEAILTLVDVGRSSDTESFK